MAKQKKQKKPDSTYLSALCGVGNAVATANAWDKDGYYVAFCFPIKYKDEEGNEVEAIYMLGIKDVI